MSHSETNAELLEHLVLQLLPDTVQSGVRVGVRRIGADNWLELHPGERSLVRLSVDRRRAEFATGRQLLRQVLGDLVDDDQPIGRLASGAPDFPHGIVGSLTHDREFAVAVVSNEPFIDSIGVDIELAGETLSDHEIAIIVHATDDVPNPIAALVTKEATYKAWSRSHAAGQPDRILEFDDICVTLRESDFSAVVAVDGTEWSGRCARVADRWAALVVSTQAPR